MTKPSDYMLSWVEIIWRKIVLKVHNISIQVSILAMHKALVISVVKQNIFALH